MRWVAYWVNCNWINRLNVGSPSKFDGHFSFASRLWGTKWSFDDRRRTRAPLALFLLVITVPWPRYGSPRSQIPPLCSVPYLARLSLSATHDLPWASNSFPFRFYFILSDFWDRRAHKYAYPNPALFFSLDAKVLRIVRSWPSIKWRDCASFPRDLDPLFLIKLD